LNLEQEIQHTALKLCILGFEPLKWSLGDMASNRAKKKRHARAEIATKLAQANNLAIRGRLQSEIARTLGVSVMTLHRWRKASHGPQPAHGVGERNGACGRGDRIALEKIRLEEAAKSRKSSA
jgi:hypothetical protein